MGEPAALDPAKLAAAAFKMLTENPLFKVEEAEIRGNSYRVFENAPSHLPALFAFCAAQNGDKEFLYYEGERMSFAETWSRACRLAHALKDKLGVSQGEHVALAMRNYPEWCVSYMAVISLGAVVVPLNAWWKADELKYGLEDSGAKKVIADGRRLEYILPHKEELGLTLVLARDEGEGADFTYQELLDGAPADTPPQVEIAPDDDFCIVYTSEGRYPHSPGLYFDAYVLGLYRFGGERGARRRQSFRRRPRHPSRGSALSRDRFALDFSAVLYGRAAHCDDVSLGRP